MYCKSVQEYNKLTAIHLHRNMAIIGQSTGVLLTNMTGLLDGCFGYCYFQLFLIGVELI